MASMTEAESDLKRGRGGAAGQLTDRHPEAGVGTYSACTDGTARRHLLGNARMQCYRFFRNSPRSVGPSSDQLISRAIRQLSLLDHATLAFRSRSQSPNALAV